MNLFSVEEFASRRRKAQTDIEARLHALVKEALDGTVNTDGYREVIAEAGRIWREIYTGESGDVAPPFPLRLRDIIERTLRLTDKEKADEQTVTTVGIWLATTLLNHATLIASRDDPEELFVEWVDMDDDKVRKTHRNVGGTQIPIGEKFHVGDARMWGPGDVSAPLKEWINCRCVLRPVLASEARPAIAASVEARDVGTEERKKDAKAGRALPDGSYPIDNCQDLRNAIQAIGRAKDPGKAKAHIRRRKSSLGCPDVSIPEGWSSDLLPNEIHPNQILVWDSERDTYAGGDMPEDEIERTESTEAPPVEDVSVEWHAVLAPEGVWSGDRRRFKEGSLRVRPLPLPMTWQKVSDDGHRGNVVVAKAVKVARVGSEMRASGTWLMSAEADEVIGLVGEFGRFGISIDADDATFEMFSDDDGKEGVEFTDARVASACIVPIPAFAEAWIALGPAPEDFFEGEEDVDVVADDAEPLPEEEVAASLVAADLAPGLTEDGPGWLTHPVDTDRLRDYWVRGEGAAKIGWGTGGDFNRCRVNLAKYVKPQYLSGYCANRHYDALGFWPGNHASVDPVTYTTSTSSANTITVYPTTTSPALSLVASTGLKAPAGWFADPQFAPDDGRMVQDPNGNWACPLTITEKGQVFGHVAAWKTCHGNWADQCVTPPRSATNYAHFLLGQVVTDSGSIPCGSLTIGGGHAAGRLRARPAIEHYDNSCSVFADVTVGEDEYGIWYAGWVRPGTSEEMIVAARASKLSGDWRKVGGSMEMVAALAVNTPGYAIPRVAAAIEDGEQVSLVAAGVVMSYSEPGVIDVQALAAAVADEIEGRAHRRAEMDALAASLEEKAEV